MFCFAVVRLIFFLFNVLRPRYSSPVGLCSTHVTTHARFVSRFLSASARFLSFCLFARSVEFYLFNSGKGLRSTTPLLSYGEYEAKYTLLVHVFDRSVINIYVAMRGMTATHRAGQVHPPPISYVVCVFFLSSEIHAPCDGYFFTFHTSRIVIFV